MKITEQLDGLRARFPACAIAAFADLSTGLVLAATTSTKVSQERLDTLCGSATNALRGPLFQTVASTIMNRASDTTSYVMQLSANSLDIFVEAPTQTDEALCLVCAHNVDVDGLVQHARDLLETLDSVH